MRKIILESSGNAYYTKKQIAEKCREIISKDGVIDVDDESFLYELLKRHPHCNEKVGVGIASFGRSNAFSLNRRIKPHKHFIVNRKDGSCVDFSWVVCLNGTTPKKDTLQALRAAVDYQIVSFLDSEFREREYIKCPLTGEEVTRQNCHVDHTPPYSFQNLVDAWLSLKGNAFDDLELIKSDDGIGCVLKNYDDINSWRNYHLKNARLRIVSQYGNLSIAKKR